MIKILNIEQFKKEDLPEIFKIGYLSNDASYVLSKVLKTDKQKIEIKDINSLKDVLIFFENVEKGKQRIKSFKYSGKDSNNISIYWQLIRLIFSSSNRSFEQIQNEILETQKELKDLIEYLENKLDLEEVGKEKKILKVRDFLFLLSKNYQNIKFSR